jgi:signal transduction histidine kinase
MSFREFCLTVRGACLASCPTVDSSEPDMEAELTRRVLVAPDVDAPLAVCSATGVLQSATPAALTLLRRLGVVSEVPAPLPSGLWSSLENAAVGDAIEWQPPQAAGGMLGCTRYVVQQVGFLLLMREVSQNHAALSEVLNRQRLESTGRLVASVAHDVRSSVASIVYSADFLYTRGAEVNPHTLRDTMREICDASLRLQLTVDGLLDFARLGPAISVPVSLREALNRAQGMLRSFYRYGAHRLRVELEPEAEWVRGNPVVIEQIFVNLLLTMAEHAEAPRTVTVSAGGPSDLEGRSPLVHTLIHVTDGGASNAEHVGSWTRAPLFTSEVASIRLALRDAWAAAESQGGDLSFETTDGGARFAVRLQRSEGPR